MATNSFFYILCLRSITVDCRIAIIVIGFATIVFDYHNEVPFVNIFFGQHVLCDVNIYACFLQKYKHRAKIHLQYFTCDIPNCIKYLRKRVYDMLYLYAPGSIFLQNFVIRLYYIRHVWIHVYFNSLTTRAIIAIAVLLTVVSSWLCDMGKFMFTYFLIKFLCDKLSLTVWP